MNCARKHTLVTGCSSGIGRSTALRLARDGQHVYAGIRKPADGDRLARSATGGEITPVILDVTEPGHIAAAAAGRLPVRQGLAAAGRAQRAARASPRPGPQAHLPAARAGFPRVLTPAGLASNRGAGHPRR
jgi:NAD(P)-dependent dehydrogenase (short-subunit alcohol dehydrogenase family)